MCFKLGIKNSFARRVAYRTDFFINFIIMVLSDMVIPFVSILIYHNGAEFPGWNLNEVILIQGMFIFTRGISCPLFDSIVYETMSLVRNGGYDVVLLKPRSPIFLSIATSMDLENLSNSFTGIAMCLYALFSIGIVPSAKQIFLFIVLIILSSIVIFSFDILMAATSFVWIGNGRLHEIFDSISNFGQYPVSIYPKAIKNIVSYIIPVGIMGFYPATMLLGKFTGNLIVLILGVVIFLIFCMFIWKKLIKRYMSAGG